MASPVILRVHNPQMLSGPPMFHIHLHTQNSPAVWCHLKSSGSVFNYYIRTWGTVRYPHIPLIFTVSVVQYLKDKPDYLSSL